MQIEDRRATADTDGAETYSTATKGIQHRIDSTYMSFLDFQATSGSDHQAILGGVSHGTRKTYISGNGIGTTKIYNNINGGTASELVFETKAAGAKVIGDLEATTASIGGVKISASSNSENYISFAGTTGDNQTPHTLTYIGERIYGGSERSELLLFKGNAPDIASSGTDRI